MNQNRIFLITQRTTRIADINTYIPTYFTAILTYCSSLYLKVRILRILHLYIQHTGQVRVVDIEALRLGRALIHLREIHRILCQLQILSQRDLHILERTSHSGTRLGIEFHSCRITMQRETIVLIVRCDVGVSQTGYLLYIVVRAIVFFCYPHSPQGGGITLSPERYRIRFAINRYFLYGKGMQSVLIFVFTY